MFASPAHRRARPSTGSSCRPPARTARSAGLAGRHRNRVIRRQRQEAASTYTDNLWSSDLMVLLVDDAVIQVAVTPLDGVPHDPDVLQLVALTAVARYQHRT